MSLKNIFKALSITYKRYHKYLFVFILVTSIIFFTVNYLTSLLNVNMIGSLLSFILLFPSLLSFKYILLKCVDRKDLDFKDYYFGYRNFKSSIGIGSMSIYKGLLMGMLGSLAGLFLGSMIFSYILVIKEGTNELTSFINSSDMDGLINYISSLSYMGSMGDIVIILSVVGFIMFYLLLGSKKIYTSLILIDNTNTPSNALKDSEIHFNKYKKSHLLYNLIFGLILSAIFILYYELTILLINIGLDSSIVNPLTSLFILYIPLVLILVLYELGLAHAYKHYFRINK